MVILSRKFNGKIEIEIPESLNINNLTDVFSQEKILINDNKKIDVHINEYSTRIFIL